MQTMAAIEQRDEPVRPGRSSRATRKIRQVNSSVATVIPEIGFDEEPISPVSREETVTNRKPKSTISTAATRLTTSVVPCQLSEAPQVSVAQIASTSNSDADADQAQREVAVGPLAAGRWPSALRAELAEVAEAGPERAEDQRQGLEEADDAARGHRPRPDVQHVGVA